MPKQSPAVQRLLRVILAGLFIYASLDKIWQPALFAKAIYNYQLLPGMLLHPAAILLPYLELVTGIMLLMNVFPRTNSGIMLGLLILFTLAVIAAVLRGLDIQCGCFALDRSGTRTTFRKIGENLILLVLAWLVWHQSDSFSQTGEKSGPGLSP